MVKSTNPSFFSNNPMAVVLLYTAYFFKYPSAEQKTLCQFGHRTRLVLNSAA
jgi:hypothetical protein